MVPLPTRAVTPEPVVQAQRSSLYDIVARHFGAEVDRAYRVMMCESQGNPGAVNQQNLSHFGLWQFKVSTWLGVGGTGMPHHASPDEQTRLAKVLRDTYGWGQWACV